MDKLVSHVWQRTVKHTAILTPVAIEKSHMDRYEPNKIYSKDTVYDYAIYDKGISIIGIQEASPKEAEDRMLKLLGDSYCECCTNIENRKYREGS